MGLDLCRSKGGSANQKVTSSMQEPQRAEPNPFFYTRSETAAPKQNGDDAEAVLFAVAHDMGTSVRAMVELPNWVEEDLRYHGVSIPDDVKSHLAMLRSHSEQMTNLLAGLTAFARAARAPDEPRCLTVQEFARRAWDKLSPASGFRLDTFNATDTLFLPRQAATDLFKAVMENTMHHHDLEKGYVVVASETDGDRVRITVEDDGPGIPKDIRETVFQPLKTLDRREETGRAGLGLTLAQKIVTKLGGSIRLTTATNGRGTAVLFDLPVRARW